MGTVGLNFGSATSGAGFDVASTVTSILAISQAIETPWNTQNATLQAHDTALTSLGASLATLATSVSALTNFDGVLASKEGSSSDTNVLTLTAASSSAIAGSHTVTVTSLASTSSVYSDVSNKTDSLTGTLTIQIGASNATAGVPPTPAQTITIGSSNNTLSSLATYINNGTYGVTASIVTDTNGSRLSLVSNASGAASQIRLGGTLTDSTTSTSLGFTSGQPGADALLTVDGLPTSSASNTVTGAIPGVTFQLLSNAANTPVQVQVTNDNAAVETAVQAFVAAYNTVAASLKSQAGNDAAGKPEPLYGDPTLALIQSQLSSALFGGSTSGSISSIQQLGITANQDGSLALDSSALDAQLNSHYADVTGFFQNVSSWGQGLSSTLGSLGSSSTTGAIALELSQNSSIEADLKANVTRENLLIAGEKTTLTAELNLANQELQAIPRQLSEINEIYSAVTGYNQQK